MRRKADRKLTRVTALYQGVEQGGCAMEIMGVHASRASTMMVSLATEASLFAWLGTLLILAKFGIAADTAIKAGPKEL